jgi:hypothetical protein
MDLETPILVRRLLLAYHPSQQLGDFPTTTNDGNQAVV